MNRAKDSQFSEIFEDAVTRGDYSNPDLNPTVIATERLARAMDKLAEALTRTPVR